MFERERGDGKPVRALATISPPALASTGILGRDYFEVLATLPSTPFRLHCDELTGQTDLIQSLTYSPNRKLHFVLVGDFKKMGKSQAEAVLKRLGAVVDAKVTSETNYVVVGAAPAGTESMDDNEAVKAAKDLNIRMITEDALSSFTRY